MKKNILNNIFTISIFALLSIIGFFGYQKLNTVVYYIHNNHIADFDDNRKLLGASDNVFVGKILKTKGLINTNSSDIPETMFEVEVLYNIKGNLKGNITVQQQAGYDIYNNLYINEGSEFMKEGNMYLLATKAESYTIISHPNGSHLIPYDVKNKNDLKKIIKENNKISEFKKAYKDELYYEENENGEKYKISSEKNAYKNLTKEEKQKIEIFENGFTE